MSGEEEQPLSPCSRMMHVPCFNTCALPLFGFATTIDIVYFKKCLEQTLMHHPRACSVLVIKDEERYDYWWRRTTPNVDDHIIVPDLDPGMESPDKFVEDYTARISKNPFDMTKPPWEIHILNIKTSDANATVIFRIHHSVGDGVSLTSVLIACGKKISDPDSLPEFPSSKKKGADLLAKGLVKRLFLFVWMKIMMVYYTLLHNLMFVSPWFFMEDSSNPFRGSPEINQFGKRFVHRTVNLEDVKFIKNALNVTVNDVLLGVTEAGLSKYLRKQYEIESENDETNDIIAKLRIRICIVFNLRASSSIEETADVIFKGAKFNKEKWGNRLAGMFIPLREFEDPLNYIKHVKTCMDKIKLSWQPQLQHLIAILYVKLFGVEFTAKLATKLFGNLSVGFSNIFGPQEEIFLFGHPLAYIAPTVSGFPTQLFIHCQSYAKKLTICLAANEKLIPNPHDLLDCLESSLESMKDHAIKRGHVKIE